MMLKRGPLEIEFEWDHGPDLTIVFYGHRTHIVSASWSAYPVLGGAKDPLDWASLAPRVDSLRTRLEKAFYDITHDPLSEAIEEGSLNADGVFDHDARTLEVPGEGLYELTFYPPGDMGMRRLMEELPVPEPGQRLSVKAIMDAIWRAVGPDAKSNEVQEDGGEFTA